MKEILNEDIYLMWLTLIEGIGAKKSKYLLECFESGENVFRASKNDLKSAQGLTEKNINKILESQSDALIEKYLNRMEMYNVNFISIKNDNYPKLLKNIFDPPIGLYVQGELPKQNLLKLAVIGSRRCSEYGLSVANRMACDLSRNNAVIVSGMARGIDTQAHLGAIKANGKTIAVLGCGLDICYPPENRQLKENISKSGCVISEYPLGTKPLASNFPVRNRIISGICEGVVIIEAGEKSGTLITVNQALEQGREVFALPGQVTSRFSYGTNELIKEGATPITNYKDILNEFYEREKSEITIEKITKKEEIKQPSLASEEKLVYDCISFEPINIENLMAKTGSELSTLQYILTILEMNGLIVKLSGQRYIQS